MANSLCPPRPYHQHPMHLQGKSDQEDECTNVLDSPSDVSDNQSLSSILVFYAFHTLDRPRSRP
ncbi:hypothetical protein ALQ78_101615 [Pseudomonas syringae pv. aptata]|nr:hypothetical protein ALQ78_101615 [Pseudomonas syringae pv. aptata]